jgi:hypothetical protein
VEKNTDHENLAKGKTLKSPSDAEQLHKKRKKARCFFTAAVSFIILGGILFLLNKFLPRPFLFIGFLFMSFLVAPILGITAGIICLPRKNILARFLLIGLIFILIPAFLIIIRMILVVAFPYVYTPSALTPENLTVYNTCIQFAKNHDGDKTLTFGRGAGAVINGHFYILRESNPLRLRVREVLTEQEIAEILNLCHQLFEIRCVLFKRDNDTLLFYKWKISGLPVDPLELTYVIPIGPGVLYSLNGENPNEIESKILNEAKPFIKIAGNWYTSRRLMLAGPRSDIQASIPKSLIDHSLRIEGINPEDLEKLH